MNMTIVLFGAADTLKKDTETFSEIIVPLYMTTQSIREKISG
jgi:hypothetical protein